MKQMKIDQDAVVQVELTGPAAILHPVVFHEGDKFCCLLGPDPTVGVFGCGETPEAALADWDLHLKEHLATAESGDEVVEHVRMVLAANKPVSKQVQEFYDQFRPVRK